MESKVPPPLPIKTRAKVGCHAPVIVSATTHPSKEVVGFDVSGDPHVVKIRVNPVEPVSAAVSSNNCVISHRIQSTANTVRINISNDYTDGDMLLKSSSPNNPYFFYHHYAGGVLPSGQSSPSDTLDSGTCSDLDGSTPPPLPKKKGAVTVTVNRINHQRGGSLTSSGADVESDDEISCDSLNSSELDGSTEERKHNEEPMIVEPLIEEVIKRPEMGNLPEKVLQDIRDRTSKISLTQQEDDDHAPLAKKISSDSTASRKSSSGIVEERTYEERKQKSSEPETEIDTDSFYKFHLNEHNTDSNNVSSGGVQDDSEDYFAGCKGYQDGDPALATIRSSKGTIRGVKNRVRAGIATFLQIHATKSWQEKEAGKVVVYTTTMGIVRETSQRCLKVRQILRTHMVKFEEKNVFMSRELQAEIKERMNLETIQLPQVFVEGHHIGDAESVERLNESGELRRILKPYKSPDACTTCQVCGDYRLLPCPVCNGSKKSVHRNHFTTELVALKCMNCDEVGLVKCYAC